MQRQCRLWGVSGLTIGPASPPIFQYLSHISRNIFLCNFYPRCDKKQRKSFAIRAQFFTYFIRQLGGQLRT